MFVCVSRLSLDIPASGSLKAKRQVLRRVTDRVKAKFNVAVAEMEDDESFNRAGVALAVVGNQRRFVTEMMDKILQFIDDMYVAPVASRETETLNLGEQIFFSREPDFSSLTIPREERSLAEAEGLGEWEKRHEKQPPPPGPSAPTAAKKKAAAAAAKLSLEEAKAAARSLRNRREWEKKG
jgi:uncharacterized protein YlxP (DUF503 family)